MYLFIFFFITFYASTLYIENKSRGKIKLTTKSRFIYVAVASVLWPVTLVAGAAIGGTILYNNKVKAIDFKGGK